MSSALNAGVAGMNANASRLTSISDNISNSGTYGYKRAATKFEALVMTELQNSGGYAAGGVRASSMRMIDERGSLVSTSNALDLAVSGRGMLPVARSTDVNAGESPNTLLMTTTGAFRTDADGVLRTASGLVLLGWPANTDGTVPLTALLEEVLAAEIGTGAVLDAEVAQTGAQRLAIWQRRELAADITLDRQPTIDTDIALPLDRLAAFFDRIEARLPALDAGAETLSVAHLGDGNIHFTVFPSRDDPALYDAGVAAVEDEVQALGGSFSAEHGVGL